MKAGHKHIYSHIEFITIQEQRIGNIFLNYYVISVIELSKIADNFDASSSWFTNRLHNPVVPIPIEHFLFMKLNTKLSVFFG